MIYHWNRQSSVCFHFYMYLKLIQHWHSEVWWFLVEKVSWHLETELYQHKNNFDMDIHQYNFPTNRWFEFKHGVLILTSQGHSICRVQNSSLHAALQVVFPWHAYKHLPLSTLFSSRQAFQSAFVSFALKMFNWFLFQWCKTYLALAHWISAASTSL